MNENTQRVFLSNVQRQVRKTVREKKVMIASCVCVCLSGCKIIYSDVSETEG